MVALDSILGYVGFISSLVGWFPSNPDRGEVRFKFWAGRDGDNGGGVPLSQAGGWLPGMYVRSTSNEWIGARRIVGAMDSNTQRQFDVSLSSNQEINYVTLVSEETDAVCLALIGWTPNDSVPNAERSKGYLIGDFFRLCGWAWNHSGQSVRVAGRDEYQPVNCGWMVADRPGYVALVNINLGVMGDGNIRHFEGKNLCGLGVGMASGRHSPPAKDTFGNVGMASGSHSPPAKRSPQEYTTTFGNEVRVHKSLSAIELCDGPTSWGSSFFSIKEGVFCDMSTKTKIPLCKAGETNGCFVYEKPIMNGRRGYSTKRNVGINGSAKKYNATYFIISDENGRVIDNGEGY